MDLISLDFFCVDKRAETNPTTSPFPFAFDQRHRRGAPQVLRLDINTNSPHSPVQFGISQLQSGWKTARKKMSSSEFYAYEDSEDSGYDMSFKSETNTEELFECDSDYWVCGTPKKDKSAGFVTSQAQELYEKFNRAFHSSLEECNSNYLTTTPPNRSGGGGFFKDSNGCKTELFGESSPSSGSYQEFYTSTPVKRRFPKEDKEAGKTKRRYATGRNRVSRAKSPSQVSSLRSYSLETIFTLKSGD